MKNSKKVIVSLSTVCLAVFILSSTVFAQMESYRWKSTFTSTGALKLGISTQYAAGGSYTATDITNGISHWKNATTNLNLSTTSFSNSNVDIMAVSEEQWFNNGWGDDTYAFSQLYDGSFQCNSGITTNYCNSSNSISYAAIYINYEKSTGGLLTSAATKTDRRRGIVAHELGHVFTIHHNGLIGVDSIMKQATFNDNNWVSSPALVDISDINNNY
ncbi:hypothetical protein J2T13_002545 [Paenibacillus sp. DS2015]|uniref:hypothetical protein n=1 Tax=Paenibacillus sp. DS2015 TaxID=3373917 RepID=UPI003D2205FF